MIDEGEQEYQCCHRDHSHYFIAKCRRKNRKINYEQVDECCEGYNSCQLKQPAHKKRRKFSECSQRIHIGTSCFIEPAAHLRKTKDDNKYNECTDKQSPDAVHSG